MCDVLCTLYFIPYMWLLFMHPYHEYIIWARATGLFSDAHVETSALGFFYTGRIHDLCRLYIRSYNSNLLIVSVVLHMVFMCV